jgi:hypothetical protein
VLTCASLGYRASAGATTARATVPAALQLRAISGTLYGVRTSIHVLTFSSTQYSLAIALANHEVDGGLETPTSMCRSTTGCVAAVNGDFFDLTHNGAPDPGDEVGGIIQNCVLLHTPEVPHQQVDLTDASVSENFIWSSSLEVNGVAVPITGINQQLPMHYTGVNLPLGGTLLFTSPYALPTPVTPGRVIYEFTQVVPTTSPTTINATAALTFAGESTSAVYVAPGDVDISAPTSSPLSSLQVGDAVTLSTTAKEGCNDIGGHPVLLDDGVVVPINPDDTYLLQRYARTVIGWTASGETVLMTVSGVDNKTGATGHQLVRLLRSLGVVTALDLDGGDSTALYANGRVVYHAGPGERAVSTGLLVIQNPVPPVAPVGVGDT